MKLKGGKGKTGVDLRYHRIGEYKWLSQAQKDELNEWREGELDKQGLGRKDMPTGSAGKNRNLRKRKAASAMNAELSALKAQVASLQKDKDNAETPAPSAELSSAQIAEVLRLYNASVGAVSADPPDEEKEVKEVSFAQASDTKQVLKSDASSEHSDGNTEEVDSAVAAAAAIGLSGILRKAGTNQGQH